jgi:beta-glucosidase
VQVYVRNDSPHAPKNPVLCGFRKLELAPGETREIAIPLAADAFTVVDGGGARAAAGGSRLYVGFGQPDARTLELTGKKSIELEAAR